MTPFMKWHSKLRHSPIFTEIRMPRKGGPGQRQIFAGEVDDDERFWYQFDPRDAWALEIPCDVERQRLLFDVYRLNAAGYEQPATPEDVAMMNKFRRDAILYANRLRSGEFVIKI